MDNILNQENPTINTNINNNYNKNLNNNIKEQTCNINDISNKNKPLLDNEIENKQTKNPNEDIIPIVKKDYIDNISKIYSVFKQKDIDENKPGIAILIIIKNIIIYLVSCIDFKPLLYKFINIDRLFHFALLIAFKYYLQQHYTKLYSMIFRDKISCLTFTKTTYLSTYLIMNNNESNSIPIQALLYYCITNKIPCVSYITDQNGSITDFNNNLDIKLESCVFLSVKITQNNNNMLSTVEVFSYTQNISYLKKFIDNCIYKYNNKKINKKDMEQLQYYIYNNFNSQNMCVVYEKTKFLSNKNFSNIFHPKKQFFIKKINNFINGKETYKKLGIPYYCGCLFYGDPGTGKTSFIKALANETCRNIIEIPFSKINTFSELKSIFSQKINGKIIENSKRIYVIEEFDCIIDTIKNRTLKESDNINTNNNLNVNTNNISQNINSNLNSNIGININKKDPITLDNLLTLIDGTCEPSDYIICITTNHIEKIDPALIRRFDIKLCFENSKTNTIMEIIHHFSTPFSNQNINDFFEDYDYYYKLINKYTFYKDNLIWSPSSICQICLLHFEKNKEKYLNNVIKNIIDSYEDKCQEFIKNKF